MKYKGLPQGMWFMFKKSFKKNLNKVLGIDPKTAKVITCKAKIKYKEIINRLPDFEPEDRYTKNIVSCAMLSAFVLNMPERPNVEQLTKYYHDSMMTPITRKFYRMSGKNKFTDKDIAEMEAAAKLRAADRNPYSWNMDFLPYPEGSGYEVRFTACGICTLMKELGLKDLIPAMCGLDYAIAEAGGTSKFERKYTLADGGPYCDCRYRKKSLSDNKSECK